MQKGDVEVSVVADHQRTADEVAHGRSQLGEGRRPAEIGVGDAVHLGRPCPVAVRVDEGVELVEHSAVGVHAHQGELHDAVAPGVQTRR